MAKNVTENCSKAVKTRQVLKNWQKTGKDNIEPQAASDWQSTVLPDVEALAGHLEDTLLHQSDV